MFRIVLSLALVAYLPGALIFRLPVADRGRRAALSAEERLFWHVMLSIGWSLATVLVLAALSQYRFERLLIGNAIISGLIAVAGNVKLLYRGQASRPTVAALLPVVLIALAAWRFFPPSEYVIGGKDPGTYVNEGVQIAQRGGLIIEDPVVSSVPPASRDLFFPWHKSPFYFSLRFMGFFVQNPAEGDVIGQFPHLFPASIALAYELDGLSGARSVVGLWAILGLVAVYLVGQRLAGTAAGAVAAGLLAINVIQVWFARYPNTEMVMQALLFASLLAFARATEGQAGFFGTVAGALLGLLLFLRYDVVLAMAAFGIAASLLPATRQRVGTAFFAALAVTASAGLWYLANPMIAYAAYPLGFTRDQGGWWLIGATGIVLLGCHAALGRDRVRSIVHRYLPAAAAIALVGLAVYAYFFRAEGGRTALHDAMAFRTFAWYVTPWVLGAMVACAAWLVWSRFWYDPAFFVTFATFSVFFFYKTRIAPEHFWASRRFLAMILPGALVVLAAGTTDAAERFAAWLGPRVRPATARWIPTLALATLVPIVATTFWRASAPVRGHVEYRGLVPELERLAGHVGDRDLLLVESRDAGSDLHMLALPLAYIYAKNVLVLDSVVPVKHSLENFLAWAHTTYENVLFLGGGGTDLLSRRLTVSPVANAAFHVPEYETAMNAYPRGAHRKDFEFGLYRVTFSEPRPNAPIDIAVGRDDDLHVVRFHARERDHNGQSFRWTGAQSFVVLLGVPGEAREVVVWMVHGGRPAGSPEAVVEAAIGEVVLGTARVDREIAPHVFRLPAALAEQIASLDDPVRLRLRVATWNPASQAGGSDTRDLGVMVTRVQVR